MHGLRRVRPRVSDGRHPATTLAVDRKIVTLSHAACIQCRACVTECPEQAVSVSHAVEVAAYTREQLARSASFDIDRATGRGTFVQVEAHQGPTLHESAERLRDRIRGRLGRSLHVRQVDAGSCNACEMEIAATTNPLYDLERFGVHLVASPRHADLLLVTGPVTRNMEIALQRTYDATPNPASSLRSVRADAAEASLVRARTRLSAASLGAAGGRVYPRLSAAPASHSQRLTRGDGIREARIASGVANDATGGNPDQRDIVSVNAPRVAIGQPTEDMSTSASVSKFQTALVDSSPMKCAAQYLAEMMRTGSCPNDRSFDRFLPEPLRLVSPEYWTPLAVAKRAADWLEDLGIRTVVDIGSALASSASSARYSASAGSLDSSSIRRWSPPQWRWSTCSTSTIASASLPAHWEPCRPPWVTRTTSSTRLVTIGLGQTIRRR